jgi:hypothetical protein
MKVEWLHIDFKSNKGFILQDFSSSPNLVLTFPPGDIVWESIVANKCIGHWHKIEGRNGENVV